MVIREITMEGKCQQQVLFAKADANQDQSKIFYKMCKAKFQDGSPTKVLIPIMRGVPAKSILRAIAPAQPVFRASAIPQGLNNMFAPPNIQGNSNATTAGNIVIVNQPCGFISQSQPSAMPLPVGTTTISHIPPGTIFFRVPAPTGIAPELMNQNILTAANIPMQAQIQRVEQNLPMGIVIAKPLPTPTVVGVQNRLEMPMAPVATKQKEADEGSADPSIPEVVIKMGEGEVWLPSDDLAKSIPRGRPKRNVVEKTRKWRSILRGTRLSAPPSLRDSCVVLDRINMSYLRDGSVNLSEVNHEQLLGSGTRQPSPSTSHVEANATSDKDIERFSLSKAERVEIILLYGRKNWSQRMVVDHFNKTHPNRCNITPSTVSRLFQKFKDTGSVMDKVRSGRPKCATKKE